MADRVVHVDIVAQLRKTYLAQEQARAYLAREEAKPHRPTMTDAQLEDRLGWTLGPADRPDRR
jgi:hypothetical protein